MISSSQQSPDSGAKNLRKAKMLRHFSDHSPTYSTSKTGFLDLPSELQLKIFKLIPSFIDKFRLERVCKSFSKTVWDAYNYLALELDSCGGWDASEHNELRADYPRVNCTKMTLITTECQISSRILTNCHLMDYLAYVMERCALVLEQVVMNLVGEQIFEPSWYQAQEGAKFLEIILAARPKLRSLGLSGISFEPLLSAMEWGQLTKSLKTLTLRYITDTPVEVQQQLKLFLIQLNALKMLDLDLYSYRSRVRQLSEIWEPQHGQGPITKDVGLKKVYGIPQNLFSTSDCTLTRLSFFPSLNDSGIHVSFGISVISKALNLEYLGVPCSVVTVPTRQYEPFQYETLLVIVTTWMNVVQLRTAQHLEIVCFGPYRHAIRHHNNDELNRWATQHMCCVMTRGSDWVKFSINNHTLSFQNKLLPEKQITANENHSDMND